jgi:AcrR family transcriptional regulator
VPPSAWVRAVRILPTHPRQQTIVHYAAVEEPGQAVYDANNQTLRRCTVSAVPLPAQPHVRIRDPKRKARILAAAADLVARRGFHAVSIAEIGAAAGITGSGVYRHFESKSAVLVALFDRVIDELLRDEQEILDSTVDLTHALDRLIAGQVQFVVGDRELAQVYYNEINNLPDEDRRRLRRKQRLYLEEWVYLVNELRADLTDADARTVVHAAVGAIQSTLFHNTGVAEDRLRLVLTGAARAILGIAD